MKFLAFSFILSAALLMAACGNTSNSTTPEQRVANTNTTTPATGNPTTPATGGVPVASSHGGGSAAPPSSSASSGASEEQTDIDTSALDAKIKKAETKAKTPNASEADKKAAAAAYVERANLFYNAQTPRLYKFALGDYRRALRLDPDNAEAREKMEMIVSIYQSFNPPRPVPTNGLEP